MPVTLWKTPSALNSNPVGSQDVVVITGGVFSSFAQVQAATSQVGVYTVISVSGTDQIYLYNVSAFQLTANNVILL
jgi:hypothetical protein